MPDDSTLGGRRSVALVSLLQLAVLRRLEVCAFEARRTECARSLGRLALYAGRLRQAYVRGELETTLAILEERWRP